MQRESDRRFRRGLVWAVVVILAVIWLGLWQWERIRGLFVAREPQPALVVPPGPVEEESPGEPSPASIKRSLLEQHWVEATGSAPAWPGDLSAPPDCTSAEQELMAICRRLDARDYVGERLQGGGTCGLLRQVTEELAAHRPSVASELKSYPAMLANVFHLFRVVGRKRLEIPREILRQDADRIEPISMVAYRWLISRESCVSADGAEVRLEALYEYAAFLTQTLGGQAYLRRRSPRVEALTGFYALLILDQAVERKMNPHGIDLRPEIRRYRELMETQPLLFRDEYVEALDQMSSRWEKRSSR